MSAMVPALVHGPGKAMILPQADFQEWNKALADAVRLIGQPAFPLALGHALRALAPFHMFNGFCYRGAEPPIDLYNDPPPHLAPIIVDAYLSRAYLLDPFFAQVQHGTDKQFLVMQEVAPDHFMQSEYFRKHYELAELSDEVGYVLRLHDGLIGVLSLCRRTGQRPFSPEDIGLLRQVAPLVCSLGEWHWNSLRPNLVQAAAPMAVDALFSELTPREAEIVRYILRGHSTESIALHLSISQETVKVHRKNLYKKLKISTQAELFALFVAL